MNTFWSITIYLSFILLLVSTTTCSTKSTQQTTVVFSNILIPGSWICNESKDTLNKRALCRHGKDSLTIVQDKFENLENKSAYIDFLMAFRHYHFETFFDYIFLDKKVKRLYRDSITIDTIIKHQNHMSTAIPCYGCNIVAQITFRNQKYAIPHQLNSQLLLYFEQYKQTFTHKPGQYSTYFNNSLKNGLSFVQIFEPSKLLITEISWNKRFLSSKSIQNVQFIKN